MTDDRKEKGFDEYKNVSVLSRMLSDDGAPSYAKYSFQEIITLRDGIESLINTDSEEKKLYLFDSLAKEAARYRKDDFVPENDYFIGHIKEVQDMPDDDIPTFYRQYLKGQTRYNRNDVFEQYWKDVIEVTYAKDSSLLRTMPRAYNAALIGESLLRSDIHAYFRYTTAGSTKEDRKKWKDWPERQAWFQSGGSSAPYVHIIAGAGRGKTSLQEENIDIALSKSNWVRTNIPVKDDPERNLHFVTKLSHLLDGEHGPTLYDFMAWREQVKKIFPAAEPSFQLIVDEKTKEKTATVEMDNKESFVRTRRHYHVPIIETSTDRSNPKVENKVTAFATIELEGADEETALHILNYQKDPATGGKSERIVIEKPSEPSFKLHYTSQDEAPPFTWDVNFDKLKELIGDNGDIREMTWEQYGELAKENVPYLTGDFESEEKEERKPAVSVCPYCEAEKPYLSKSTAPVRCSECKQVFQVIPEEGYNYHIIDREYEQKKKDEIRKAKEEAELQKEPDVPKEERIGVAVCPYCRSEREYRKGTSDTAKCTNNDCNEIFLVDPEENYNWHPISKEYEAERIRKAKEEASKPRSEKMHPLDELILKHWNEIKKNGNQWFCDSFRIDRKKPRIRTVQKHIKQLKENGDIRVDNAGNEIVTTEVEEETAN